MFSPLGSPGITVLLITIGGLWWWRGDVTGWGVGYGVDGVGGVQGACWMLVQRYVSFGISQHTS